jgi:hypothetical protein
MPDFGIDLHLIAGIFREGKQIDVGGTYPTDLLFSVRRTMYKMLYTNEAYHAF